jgi:hypothetical protein
MTMAATETKFKERENYTSVYENCPVEVLPVDPIVFDGVMYQLYVELEKVAKPDVKTEITINVQIGQFEKFLTYDEFKTEQYKKNSALLDILCKYKIIKSYSMEFGKQPLILKKWGQRDADVTEVAMPIYKVSCQLIPSLFYDYITDRFQMHKGYFEEVTEVYSRLVEIMEAFIAGGMVINLTLNGFYESLARKFRELMESDIRPTLYEELVLPYQDLILDQEQIAKVKQDTGWILRPMYDNHSMLRHLISFYDLQKEQDPDFEEIDEYLQSVRPNKNFQASGQQPKAQLIEKLTLIRTVSNASVKIVVNEDYKHPFKVSLNKAPWKLLLRLAEKEEPLCQNIPSLKSIMDYLNSNDSCKLYTNSGKGLTKVIEQENGKVVQGVPMEAVSSQTFQQRLNKLKST